MFNNVCVKYCLCVGYSTIKNYVSWLYLTCWRLNSLCRGFHPDDYFVLIKCRWLSVVPHLLYCHLYNCYLIFKELFCTQVARFVSGCQALTTIQLYNIGWTLVKFPYFTIINNSSCTTFLCGMLGVVCLCCMHFFYSILALKNALYVCTFYYALTHFLLCTF